MGADQVIYNRLVSGDDINAGIPDLLARILVAQSQWETGNYSSDVFLNANNAFGYKYTGASRWQTGSYRGYGVYQGVDQSAAELLDYIWRRVDEGSFPGDLDTITTPGQYVALLGNAGYFEDSVSHYANGVQSYFGSFTPDSVGVGSLAIAAISGFLLYSALK